MPITPIEEFVSKSFEYVIVGGGTAGLVIAARLSEDPSVEVGVIEAGGFVSDKPETYIPGYFGRALRDPLHDWSFTTVEQKNANDRNIPQWCGKSLGGSSNLNFMVSGRGSAEDYDAFEKLGNPGWNWSSFLHYFRKVEGLDSLSSNNASTQASSDELKPEFHGLDGPLKQSIQLRESDLHPLFLSTCQNAGLGLNSDAGSGNVTGIEVNSVFTVHPERATRSSSSTAYFEPNQERPNLSVLVGARATRIKFGSHLEDLVAQGVELTQNGKLYVANAKREVIITAGAFGTPQLLELSGIGRKEFTTDLGIKQLVNLPGVGENMQDHLIVPCVFEVQDRFETLECLMDPEQAEMELKKYEKRKEGLLATPGFIGKCAFIPAGKVFEDEDFESFKAKYLQSISTTAHGLKKQFKLQLECLNNSSQALAEILSFAGSLPFLLPTPIMAGRRYQSLIAVLLHPLSRGNVHISSADPLVSPAIDPQYLSNAADVDLLVTLCKYSRKLSDTEPLKSATITTFEPNLNSWNDEALVSHIKKTCHSMAHPTGTASMLPREDGGVVDSRLVVYGTKNLRVADASVIPLIVSAHTQMTVYAIAEKAADLIKEDRA